MAYLTASRRIAVEATHEYLDQMARSVLSGAPFEIAIAWTLAVAYLGLEDLSGRVEELYKSGSIPYGEDGLEFFRNDLRRALGDPTRMICFLREEIGPVSGVVRRLSRWFPARDEKTEALLH
jgi:hypothetical protein